MYTIQANPSGTRSLEISEENLATIEKYGLFRPLPHRITRRRQQRLARPLHRRDIPQQHESLRITATD